MPYVLALLLLITTTAALAQTARVIDGDTLELSTGERIRLWGIDAVEDDQICQHDGGRWDCGADAAAALEALIAGHRPNLHGRDRAPGHVRLAAKVPDVALVEQ